MDHQHEMAASFARADLEREAHRIVTDAFNLAVQYLPISAGKHPQADNTLPPADISHAQEQLAALRRAAEILDAQLLDRELANVEAQARASELECLHEELAAATRTARTELVSRTEELHDLARRAASTDERLRTLNLRIADQQNTLDGVHHDLRETRERISQEQSLLTGLQVQVTQAAENSVGIQSRIEQAQSELNGALHTLRSTSTLVEQFTDLVEHDDVAGRAADQLHTVSQQLGTTVTTVADLANQLHVAARQTEHSDTDYGDVLLHAYTTVTVTLQDIKQRINVVIDLHDRLGALAAGDPDIEERDPTGGRTDSRSAIIADLRQRAEQLAATPSTSDTARTEHETDDLLFGPTT